MSEAQREYVAVVTGASAGVGRATVRALVRAHGPRLRIGLLARGSTGLEATRAEVEAQGGEALALPTDVAVAEQVNRAAEAVSARWRAPDLWVNNAMVTVFSPVRELQPDEVRRVTEVTYLGVVYGTLAALQMMLPEDRGVIIQVGSALAYRGIPLQAAYCGAKHAIQGFTESLRCELLHDHSRVRVTMVQMPALNTPQFGWLKNRLPRKAKPVPPIFQPEVAAEAILFAATHARRQVLVGWPTVEAVEVNKLVPGRLDHYLARTGYDAQQTGEPEDPARPNNLWQPVEGDRGARGTFNAEARSESRELWIATHRPAGAQWAAVGGAVVAGAAAWAWWRRAA